MTKCCCFVEWVCNHTREANEWGKKRQLLVFLLRHLCLWRIRNALATIKAKPVQVVSGLECTTFNDWCPSIQNGVCACFPEGSAPPTPVPDGGGGGILEPLVRILQSCCPSSNEFGFEIWRLGLIFAHQRNKPVLFVLL